MDLRRFKTKIKCNNSYEGESIEKKIERVTTEKEPITDTAPIIYTDRRDGVRPEYDIRTDRWELAIDAMDKITAGKNAQRQEWSREKCEAENAEIGSKE